MKEGHRTNTRTQGREGDIIEETKPGEEIDGKNPINTSKN